MLYLNASDSLLDKWRKSIDLYYAMHLSGFFEEIKSVTFSLEEVSATSGRVFRCQLHVVPQVGHTISSSVERENCLAAIDYSFAKAKRQMQRRSRGMSRKLLLGDLANG